MLVKNLLRDAGPPWPGVAIRGSWFEISEEVLFWFDYGLGGSTVRSRFFTSEELVEVLCLDRGRRLWSSGSSRTRL